MFQRSTLRVDSHDWPVMWEKMGQLLKDYSAPVAWKLTPEQLQDPVKVSEYLKEKCCGSSREMQSSAMCRALVTIYQTLLTILDSTLKEKRSKAE